MTTSLTELIKGKLSAGFNDNKIIASDILTELAENPEVLHDALFSVVANEVTRIRRDLVRVAEQVSILERGKEEIQKVISDARKPAAVKIITRAPKKSVSGVRIEVGNAAADKRLAFLDERFWTPNDGFILWGVATDVQHLERISYLEGKSDEVVRGIERTITRHEVARKLLAENSAATLNEVFADNPEALEGFDAENESGL